MEIIECTEDRYANEILAIFNHAIVNTTALFDYKPRTPKSMTLWFENKKRGNYPVVGAVDDDGKLLGFVTYGAFRAWPAYKYTVEHSVYVHHEHRQKGIGEKLMVNIIEQAVKQEYHVLVGAIESTNESSIKLHNKLGFKSCGTIFQAGYKFERWLDLSFYQLIFNTPTKPNEA